jgi:putative spermidine/putrescine transport system permease protein
MGRRRIHFPSGPAGLALPALAFTALFAIYPLVQFAIDSVWVRGVFTWTNYVQLFTSSYFGDVLARTVLTSLGVMVVCILIGYPLAYFLNRAPGRAKVILIALVVLPYLTSVLVRVFAWSALLGLKGPINNFLVAVGIFAEPQQLGHSFTGTLIGLVHVLTPIAVLSMWATMSRIQRGHEVTAGALGASPTRVFMTVFLPLSMPGVATGALLVYVLSLGAYIIPVALGATNGLLFAQVVADQATVALNWPLAGAMTVAMLVFGLIPLVIVRVVQALAGLRRNPYPVRNRIASRFVYPVLDVVSTAVWVGIARTVAILVLAFLVLPEIVVIIFSFGPVHDLSLPPAHLTLDGYQQFFADPRWIDAMGRSFAFAGVDAVIALALGGLAAYGLARSRPRIFAIGLGILLFPLALPEIVPALSFYVFANGVHLAGTPVGVIVGQGVTALGLAALITSTVVRNIDVNLEYASQMSGASRLQTILRIVAPLALPGLIVGGLYGFLNAFDNLVLPLFVAGFNQTIPVRMFFSMQDQLNSIIAVVATLLIGLLLAATAIAVIIMSKASTRIDVADVAKR